MYSRLLLASRHALNSSNVIRLQRARRLLQKTLLQGNRIERSPRSKLANQRKKNEKPFMYQRNRCLSAELKILK